MSRQNAEENLKNFAKELKLPDVAFDQNNTCILFVDGEFSLHLTYEEHSDRLYVYAPLLDGLPDNTQRKLLLYEKLLEGSMLGGQMAGGGVGVATKEQLILMHCVLDMKYAETNLLKAFAQLFIETVVKWRTVCADICAGREPSVDTMPQMPQTGGGMQPPPSGIRA
ncbi:type III secretion chaperone Slc1 [Chlamydia gallinacea]|uniref:Type III secretion system chaperone n=2 Tax=Chlamydia gallinacea TaxID=1457153 RepID=A0A173DZW8_9CHLA|nr:type III secretion chaperone Slc1 [Chlamydia gallinacea]EYE60409.1 tir chaperone family protein [Bacteroides fragilis str. S6L5]ANG66436.1 type III secretion system chaperone [Chlamydia gallinacea 08-1274/3]AQT77371.1 Tir chaperone family protein [Chlamydia gallinacea]MBX6679834.1 type III secretion chaperone Slc1 [Chlamydia gallinacea]MBX6687637.1 type III secretion chaperone Slc1 [Chlamydia gallinacea]